VIRTQIQLTEAQHRRIKRIAQDEGVSLSEIIRRFIDRGLARPQGERAALYERAAALVGAFRAAERDLSTEHDRHLEKAFE
jgi:hypothetical protein